MTDVNMRCEASAVFADEPPCYAPAVVEYVTPPTLQNPRGVRRSLCDYHAEPLLAARYHMTMRDGRRVEDVPLPEPRTDEHDGDDEPLL